MKDPDRKVLKLSVSRRDLQRFVRAQGEEGTQTLAKTLSCLLDAYEAAKGVTSTLPDLRKGSAATQRPGRS